MSRDQWRLRSPIQRNFIDATRAFFMRHLLPIRRREGLVPEALAAIALACRKDWQLAQALGRRVSDFLRERMRNEEAAETLGSILIEARRRNDKSAIQQFEWEISWLQDGDQVRAPIVAPQQLQLTLTF